MKSILASLALFAASSRATVVWSGIFNSSFAVADFDKCEKISLLTAKNIDHLTEIRRVMVEPDSALAMVHSRVGRYV